MDSVLVTGGEGVLGSQVRGRKLTQAEMDVTDMRAVMRVVEAHRPCAIVHCAALVDLAECEGDPARAYLINTVGTYHVALAARSVGARLVYVSTSAVFDGHKQGPYEPNDVPNPQSVYGRSKHLGELAAAAVEDHCVVRTSWLFGGGPARDKKFVGQVLARLRAGEPVRAVTDRRGSPTYAKDLAVSLAQIALAGPRGIIHVGGESASRFEVAQALAALVAPTATVAEARASDFPTPYAVGENESVLSNMPLRPWREALKEYSKEVWH